MIDPDFAARQCMKLYALRFFPEKPEAFAVIVKLVSEMAISHDQIEWLMDRMMACGIFDEWPGPGELRAAFCWRFKPRDGIERRSRIVESWPEDRPVVLSDGRILEAAAKAPAPLMLPEPEDRKASGAPQIQAAFDAMSTAKSAQKKSVSWDDPVTEEEIRNAPRWLRKLEGYE